MNGPGTPRPVNRPKVSLSAPMTTNGLPDSAEHKDSSLQEAEDKKHRLVRRMYREVLLFSVFSFTYKKYSKREWPPQVCIITYNNRHISAAGFDVYFCCCLGV